jgi:hypothetical protein
MAATSFSFINGSPNCDHKAGCLVFERAARSGVAQAITPRIVAAKKNPKRDRSGFLLPLLD